MVVLVDDLDRCRPSNVLDVLEAVNFLVTSGSCVVIIGMDTNVVKRCVCIGAVPCGPSCRRRLRQLLLRLKQQSQQLLLRLKLQSQQLLLRLKQLLSQHRQLPLLLLLFQKQ